MTDHLWPKVSPRLTGSEAEKRFYEALRSGLPERWWAWHSLRLRSTSSGRFDEADFIIADPGRPGILIIEVKGGLIEIRDGQWYQNGRPMDSRPLDEAVSFRTILAERIKDLNLNPPTIGCAVCFPATISDHRLQGEGLQGILIGCNDLPHLRVILPDIMNRAVPDPWSPSQGWIDALHRLWGETWVPGLCLGSKVHIDEERRLPLDLEQIAVLESLEENDRLLIRGSAGTGKTLLAREAALREAEEGKRVLFLCYTDALALNLKRSLAYPNLTVNAVRTFASALLGEKAPDKSPGIPSEYWESVSIRAALDGLPPRDERWDTVIVDEGQDLSTDDWELVRECLVPQGRLWVFADETQAFWKDRGVPEDIIEKFMKFTLKRPYRCHPAIQHLSDCYGGPCDKDPQTLRAGIKDGTINIVTSSEGRLLKQIGKEINRFLSGGLAPSQIAVLSLRGRGSDESIVHHREIGDHRVVPATDPDAEDNIVCDTFLRFKGLERPAVIVTDFRLVPNLYEKRMHIAVSRAQSFLRIVGVKEEIEEDPILVALT